MSRNTPPTHLYIAKEEVVWASKSPFGPNKEKVLENPGNSWKDQIKNFNFSKILEESRKILEERTWNLDLEIRPNFIRILENPSV